MIQLGSRDRFILSGGHASLTQYVQLYFSGYGVTLDDLKNFRGGAAPAPRATRSTA